MKTVTLAQAIFIRRYFETLLGAERELPFATLKAVPFRCLVRKYFSGEA